MNILILSCGTRNKIIQYFREAVREYGGKIIAADCSRLAPALYEADQYYVVKRMDENGYLEQIQGICEKESINGVISLIDQELSLLAEYAEAFRSMSTEVIGSSYDLCEMSLDKYKMYEWMTEHKFNCAKSYRDCGRFFDAIDEGSINYPVLLKPIKGSASINISMAENKRCVEFLLKQTDGLFIQEYLDGEEIGADVYIDLISGEVISIFTKKKIKMRAGETDKSVSFKDEKLFGYIEKFVIEAGYRGQIDIDLFEIGGEYYISEVNPRFGGGYPHAHECGCNHMRLIMENLKGKRNSKCVGDYDGGVYMMKYNEVRMIKEQHG